jgi:hypothetical protein
LRAARRDPAGPGAPPTPDGTLQEGTMLAPRVTPTTPVAAAPAAPADHRIPTHIEHTALVRRMLHARTPRPDAVARVRTRTLPLRTCYETDLRVEGPVDAVLDYAAWLLAPEAAPPDGVRTPYELVAAEDLPAGPDGPELAVVLGRALYDPDTGAC